MRTLTIAIGAVMLLLLVAAPQGQSTKQLTQQDYIEIQQLYARYAHVVDSSDKDGLAKLFTEDAMFTLEDKGTRTFPARSMASQPRRERPKMVHFITNIVIDPIPEGARVTHYVALTNFQKSPAVTGGGWCDDVAVKMKEGWRIKKRFCAVEPGPPAPAGQSSSR